MIFTCFTPAVEPDCRSFEYLRSFGERYLHPFSFSPGASFDFLTVLPLSDEKNKEYISSYNIWTFHPKMGALFRMNRVRNWFRGNWSVLTFFKRISSRNGKRRRMPLLKRLLGLSRKAGPIHPFPGSNTPAKVLKPPFSVFKTGFAVRHGLIS